jgi:hypothetical protein
VSFKSGFADAATKGGSLSVRAVRGGPLACRRRGQTGCWDGGGEVIACAATGQDGDIRAGVPLSFTDNGDGTITDNNTGLVWEKLSQDQSIHGDGAGDTWDNAFSVHVATLNGTRFAGHGGLAAAEPERAPGHLQTLLHGAHLQLHAQGHLLVVHQGRRQPGGRVVRAPRPRRPEPGRQERQRRYPGRARRG